MVQLPGVYVEVVEGEPGRRAAPRAGPLGECGGLAEPRWRGDESQSAICTLIQPVKEARARIEDKERQLRQVIDSIPTPMCYVDAEGLYRYVNDAFLAYIGLPAERIVGRPVREILGETPIRGPQFSTTSPP